MPNYKKTIRIGWSFSLHGISNINYLRAYLKFMSPMRYSKYMQNLVRIGGALTALSVIFLCSGLVSAVPPTVDPADYSSMRESVKSVTLPDIERPDWLKQQLAAEAAQAAAAHRAASTVNVTYDVTTKGTVYASLAEFKLLANQTLNDGRGWARMNVKFTEVVSGGMFTLVLAEASQLPTYSSGCSSDYSCRAGRYVVINQDRWMGATSSWNSAGGSLRDYRHMVVNHETGHWLGHDHESCGGAGQPAPVMQQQSISLQGCSFNPWPLASELYSSQLGI